MERSDFGFLMEPLKKININLNALLLLLPQSFHCHSAGQQLVFLEEQKFSHLVLSQEVWVNPQSFQRIFVSALHPRNTGRVFVSASLKNGSSLKLFTIKLYLNHNFFP